MEDYSEQWGTYRRLRNIALVVFFGLIPLSWIFRVVSGFFGASGDYVLRFCFWRGSSQLFTPGHS
jgi:hypothetical protein